MRKLRRPAIKGYDTDDDAALCIDRFLHGKANAYRHAALDALDEATGQEPIIARWCKKMHNHFRQAVAIIEDLRIQNCPNIRRLPDPNNGEVSADEA